MERHLICMKSISPLLRCGSLPPFRICTPISKSSPKMKIALFITRKKKTLVHLASFRDYPSACHGPLQSINARTAESRTRNCSKWPDSSYQHIPAHAAIPNSDRVPRNRSHRTPTTQTPRAWLLQGLDFLIKIEYRNVSFLSGPRTVCLS